jgi:hypothetical protein
MRIAIDAEPRVWHKGSYCYSLEDLSMVVPNVETLKARFHGPDEHGPHLLSSAGRPKGTKT